MAVFNQEYGYLNVAGYLSKPYLSPFNLGSLGVELDVTDTGKVGVELFALSEEETPFGVQLIESNLGITECNAGRGYLSQPYLST